MASRSDEDYSNMVQKGKHIVHKTVNADLDILGL